MKNRHLALLLQLLICIVIVLNEGSVTEMSDCHGHSLLHFESDKPMEICCKVDTPDCVENPALLTLKKRDKDKMVNMDVVVNSTGNVSSVRLISSSPAPDIDSGMYYCYCNNKSLEAAQVVVIDQMKPPRILRVTSTMQWFVTVIFYPGSIDATFFDSYTVFAEFLNYTLKTPKKEKMVMCENKTISCDGMCTCQSRINHLGDKNITISVFKQRSILNKSTSVVVNLLNHIKPDPFDDVQIKDVNSTSSVLKVCAPNCLGCWGVIRRMNHARKPLRIHLSITKTQGLYEKRMYNFTLKTDVCLQMYLSQLIPFTKYNVSVIASGGGGYGLPSVRTFTTLEAAPLLPPEDVVYWVVRDKAANYTSDFQQFHSIYIYWKSTPHDKKGGAVSYKLIVSFDHKNYSKTVTESHCILQKIPNTPVTVKVYSKNKIGLSEYFNQIKIEKFSEHADIEQLQSHVETAGNQADIYIEKIPSSSMISGIYWCAGNQSSQSPSQVMCKELPQIVLNGTDLKDGKDMLSAFVSLRKKKCQVETMSEFTQEAYKWIVRNNAKPRPSVLAVTGVREFAKGNDPCTSPDQIDDVTKDSSEYHKFMLAVKDSQRLFPFKCYYDKYKDIVRLSVSQLGIDENRMTLEWKQYCDSNPLQFLAKEYFVYTSQDRHCVAKNANITKVENTILQSSKVDIPRSNNFVCVKASNSLSESTSVERLSPLTTVRGDGDDNRKSIIIGITVAAAILVLVCLSFCVGLCRWRKRKVDDDFRSLFPNLKDMLQFENKKFVSDESDHHKDEDDSDSVSTPHYDRLELEEKIPPDNNNAPGKFLQDNETVTSGADKPSNSGNNKDSCYSSGVHSEMNSGSRNIGASTVEINEEICTYDIEYVDKHSSKRRKRGFSHGGSFHRRREEQLREQELSGD